jgi:tetratricopeptide (TPR) repeat protein
MKKNVYPTQVAGMIRPTAGLLCVAIVAAQGQAPDDYMRGKTAFDAHHYAEAASFFTKAEADNPGASDALLFEGKSLVNLQRFPEADQAFRKYLLRHPVSADGLYMLGFVLNREDKPRESLEIYNRAAQLSAPQSDDLKTAALDYVLLNDYSDAIQWLRRAVELDPRNQQAWYGLGRCYYTQSEFPDAEQAFTRALALEPQDLKAATNLALTLEMRNQSDEADRAYKNAISLADADPHTDEWPYLDYGSFLLERNRAAEAIPLLRKATALAPNCADCHGKLGRALDATGKFGEAVAELERAVALSPRDPTLHYALGRAYRSAGMMEKSKQELALCAKLYGTKDSTGSK